MKKACCIALTMLALLTWVPASFARKTSKEDMEAALDVLITEYDLVSGVNEYEDFGKMYNVIEIDTQENLEHYMRYALSLGVRQLPVRIVPPLGHEDMLLAIEQVEWPYGYMEYPDITPYWLRYLLTIDENAVAEEAEATAPRVLDTSGLVDTMMGSGE